MYKKKRLARGACVLAVMGLLMGCATETLWPSHMPAGRGLPARLSQPLPEAWMRRLGPVPVGQEAQLLWVQARLNRLPFRSDAARWGVEDYWASPEEFLASGGDCEDYALAKMAVLRRLGWREEALELVLVRDLARNRAHAVLRVHDTSGDWLLDNQSAGLLPTQSQTRYFPLAGYNAQGGWRY